MFEISRNPGAATAYAWSSTVKGSDNRRVFAVLHILPIASPVAVSGRLSWRSTATLKEAKHERRKVVPGIQTASKPL